MFRPKDNIDVIIRNSSLKAYDFPWLLKQKGQNI